MDSLASQVGLGLMTLGFTGVLFEVWRKESTRAQLRRRGSAIFGGVIAIGLALSLFAAIHSRNTLYISVYTYLLLTLALTARKVILTSPDAE